MTLAIVWFSVLVILSNPVLGNVEEQSAQRRDSSTVFLALETLTKAVESLQTKIDSQEAKAEMQVSNLESKMDTQGSILRNLEAVLEKVESNVKELVTKEACQEPIAHSPTNGTIGIPLPESRWANQNGTLESEHVVVENNGQVLRIKNDRLNDEEDSYVCVAANGAGTPGISLSNFEAKVEMQFNNLETKVDVQANSSSTSEAESKMHSNLLNNLQVTTAAMEANLLSIFEDKFSVLANLVNNVMAEDQKQVTSLNNVEAKLETQAALLTNLNATINKQVTSLINLEAESKLQNNSLNYLVNTTATHANQFNNLNIKVDTQISILNDLQARSNVQVALLAKLNSSQELQASLLSNLEAGSNALKHLLNSLQNSAGRHSNLLNELETKADLQATLLTNSQAQSNVQAISLNNSVNNLNGNIEMQATSLSELKAQLNVQATSLNKLVAEVEWHEPVTHFKPNRTIVAFVGDDVEMWCVVRGTPLPEIRWTRENGTLESDRAVVENDGKVLRIKNAQLNDEGSYVCVAANGIGNPATQSVRLQVYDPSQECNRIIESDKGKLARKAFSSGCMWLLKLQNTTGFRVQLDPLLTEPILFISEPNSSNPNVQTTQLTGSRDTTHLFQGKSLAIVVPPRRERTILSWTGLDVDDSGVSSSTKFVNDTEGKLEWESQRDGTDKIFWAIDLELNGELNWTLSTASTARDQESPCETISLSVFQITPDGTISEVYRNCDGSSEGSLKLEVSSQVLVLGHFKSLETSMTKLRVSWTHHDEPMEKNVDGIVAGADDGAFVIPFNSAQTQVVPSGQILGLTFDWNSRRIYYLKKKVGIMRSNLNGSESEILSSDRSSALDGMTIEPASGNLYYGNQTSGTIRVCDNDARKCSTIANSNDLNYVQDVAVHLSKGLLFWSIWGGKIVRANLDGSNAIVVLKRHVYGLDVDEHEDRLYWISIGRIGSCDMNGQHIRELPIGAGRIYDVAIDNDKVYFSSWDTDAVHVTSKLGTNSRMVAQLTADVSHIAFFGTRVSNRPANPCAKANCAHLCVLVTRWTYRCTCPDGQLLNADGKTCNI